MFIDETVKQVLGRYVPFLNLFRTLMKSVRLQVLYTQYGRSCPEITYYDWWKVGGSRPMVRYLLSRIIFEDVLDNIEVYIQ